MGQTASERRIAAGYTRRLMDERYSRVAIVLHWSIAAIIICNLLMGFIVWSFFNDVFRPMRPLYWHILTFHISLGLTALALTVVRILWRLVHQPPPYPDGMKQWERQASHFAHFFLYAAMLFMPLTGWSIISSNAPVARAGNSVQQATPAAGPAPSVPIAAEPGNPPPVAAPARAGGGFRPKLWWVFPMPVIKPLEEIGAEPGGVEPQRVLHEKFEDYHAVGAWLTLLLLLLHVAGALKHQWIDRRPTLQRMGLGQRPDGTPDANVQPS